MFGFIRVLWARVGFNVAENKRVGFGDSAADGSVMALASPYLLDARMTLVGSVLVLGIDVSPRLPGLGPRDISPLYGIWTCWSAGWESAEVGSMAAWA